MSAPAQPNTPDRVVIVGASLAGLRAAEHLRELGFSGLLHVVGDEALHPYDRTPLSKALLHRQVAPSRFRLVANPDLDVRWMLGTAAAALHLEQRRVVLTDGSSLDYDRLVIATGRRARPWQHPGQAGFEGVLTLRNLADGEALRTRLLENPGPLVIVGAGFIGSEVASAARDLGVEVTVVSRGQSPLDGALGNTVGTAIAALYSTNGVDLRRGVSATALHADANNRVTGVQLADGTVLPASTVLVATGTLANVEWLAGSGLDSIGGVAVDGALRALTEQGTPSADIVAAGDVTRWTSAAAGNPLVATEHWGNAVVQGRQAAETILGYPDPDPAAVPLPSFWSSMFGVTIKSVGVASFGDEVAVVQGSLAENKAVLVYGREGRTVAALTLDAPRDLPFYASLVENGAPFPPRLGIPEKNRQGSTEPQPALFPARAVSAPSRAPAPAADRAVDDALRPVTIGP